MLEEKHKAKVRIRSDSFRILLAELTGTFILIVSWIQILSYYIYCYNGNLKSTIWIGWKDNWALKFIS